MQSGDLGSSKFFRELALDLQLQAAGEHQPSPPAQAAPSSRVLQPPAARHQTPTPPQPESSPDHARPCSQMPPSSHGRQQLPSMPPPQPTAVGACLCRRQARPVDAPGQPVAVQPMPLHGPVLLRVPGAPAGHLGVRRRSVGGHPEQVSAALPERLVPLPPQSWSVALPLTGQRAPVTRLPLLAPWVPSLSLCRQCDAAPPPAACAAQGMAAVPR